MSYSIRNSDLTKSEHWLLTNSPLLNLFSWCVSVGDTCELRHATCKIIDSHVQGIPCFKKFAFQKKFNKIENLFHVYNMR